MNIMWKIRMTGGDYSTGHFDRFIYQNKCYEHYLDRRFIETALQLIVI